MEDNKKTFTEKRRFFRISDYVNLSYRLVDEPQIQHPIQSTSSLLDNCSLTSALELIAEEATILHGKLEQIHSDFADYLKLLNIKIDLVAQAVISLSNIDEVSANQTRNANISISGVGFDCDEQLKIGQYLEVKILLVHSTTVILVYAKVIHCFKYSDPVDIYPYFVGVDFVNIKEADCDLLSKHVAKKQLQQLRQQNEQRRNA